MEQREEAWQWEKAQRVMNDNDNDASRLPTMTTMMTTMTMSCQSLPFLLACLLFG
jgi:hypothetical protein